MTSRKKFEPSSFDWLRALNRIAHLSKGAVKVGVAIWSYNFGKMEAFPNYSALAVDCGWRSTGRLSEYVRELVDAELLVVTKVMVSGRPSNHYTLVVPSHADEERPHTSEWDVQARQSARTSHDGVNVRENLRDHVTDKSIEECAPSVHVNQEDDINGWDSSSCDGPAAQDAASPPSLLGEIQKISSLYIKSDSFSPGIPARRVAASPHCADRSEWASQDPWGHMSSGEEW